LGNKLVNKYLNLVNSWKRNPSVKTVGLKTQGAFEETQNHKKIRALKLRAIRSIVSEFTAEQLREKPGVTVAEWSPTFTASKPGITRIKLKLISFS
jgi:hypothetical protein